MPSPMQTIRETIDQRSASLITRQEEVRMQNEKAQVVSTRPFPGGTFGLMEMIDQRLRLARFHLKRLRHNTRRRVAPLSDFSRELLRTPRQIGAIYPSSKRLGQAMAEVIDLTDDRLVIELGAGTGSITQALLQRGVQANRLIVLERSQRLAHGLRQRFPMLMVIQGDAADLSALLADQVGNIGSVVSSLPLRSLEPATADAIIAGILETLADGGRLVQFTYDLRRPSVPEDTGLHRIRSRRVWANLPPARVDLFRYQPSEKAHVATEAAR